MNQLSQQDEDKATAATIGSWNRWSTIRSRNWSTNGEEDHAEPTEEESLGQWMENAMKVRPINGQENEPSSERCRTSSQD